MPPLELNTEELLARGEVDVHGRVPWSSNATFLASVRAGVDDVLVVYKPSRGERPLWDFPSGTLAAREAASFTLSEWLGWRLVPPTVLRDGPLGAGMVQVYVEHDPDDHYFTLLGDHTDRFRTFAVFDVVANNADRKAGHCLRDPDGHIWGIDHGLTFHRDWKLRTVVWDFAGEPVPEALVDDVCRLEVALSGALASRLEALLSAREVAALRDRCGALVRGRRFPEPDAGPHSVPWPLV